ncbi:MAG: hypothetical protein QM813_17080 [Verrucomicrobiota bacterium]
MRTQKFWKGRATVEIIPGSHIETAAQDAIDLAKLIDGPVHFEFNGVMLSVKPDSTVADISKRFDYGLQYEKLASSLNGRAGE